MICHSGARAMPANPESMNTVSEDQWLGPRSWIPGPALTGRPGMTAEFFRTLLSDHGAFIRRAPLP
jgi:hypothetical protein